MSLILDALNRADQERSEEHKPINLHAGYSPAAANNPIRRWIIEGVLVSIAIAAFVYSQWQQPATDMPTNPPVVATNTVVANSTPSPIPNTLANTTPPPPIVTAVADVVEVEVPPESTPLVADNSTSKQSIASLYQQQAEPINTAEAIPVTPAVEKSVAPKIEKPIAPAVEEKVEILVDNTEFILQQIPLLMQMSSRFQKSIPAIDYSVHAYAAGGKGFVTMNGAVRKTGAIIEPGIRIIAILPDSVVLEFSDKQFRLPALNSWVNYQ